MRTYLQWNSAKHKVGIQHTGIQLSDTWYTSCNLQFLCHNSMYCRTHYLHRTVLVYTYQSLSVPARTESRRWHARNHCATGDTTLKLLGNLLKTALIIDCCDPFPRKCGKESTFILQPKHSEPQIQRKKRTVNMFIPLDQTPMYCSGSNHLAT